ncbi:MAG TPA: T9SS type A sorting domain-containing protein [Flavobacterium sp.]|nr:T9SS type A sorting domain-containing protein [Flavobacterium sp.]
MKKLYTLLLVLSAFTSSAQIINIPDEDLLWAIMWDQPEIDWNNDGQLDMAEVVSVTSLHLYHPSGSSGWGIQSLEGLQHFPNLVHLECQFNELTSIDLSLLHLEYLDCSYNQLTSLILNPELEYLLCQHNQLTSLDLSPVSYIDLLDISYNQITSFEIPESVTFGSWDLNVSGNYYTSFTLPDTGSFNFFCDDTFITELDFSGLIDISMISIHNNPDLQYINFRNGNDGDYVSLSNNPALVAVCTDEYEQPSIINHINNPNVTATEYCAFMPAAPYNTITGTINYANDGACTMPGAGMPIFIDMNFYSDTSFANNIGNYTVYSWISDNVTLVPQPLNYYSVTPSSFTSTFSGFGNTVTADFCATPSGIHPDLEVTLLPLVDARPGFDAHYRVVVRNTGTQVQSGSVSIAFDDSTMDFISAIPAIQSQVVNNITWNFNSIAPFETRTYDVIYNVNSPMEIPAVNNGDILVLTASLSTAEVDETPADNVFDLSQIVVGSFDPNDITVLEGATISPDQTDEYLTYVVRFQNSGTAAAENVVVKDMITPNLDQSTMQILTSSHPFRSTITNDNKLEFFFENIMLPAEQDDEPGSHGYIAYRMKPKSTVGLGDVMEKTAGIYFDYNWPIVTNTASTTVTLLGTNTYTNNSAVTLYPNPVENYFQVKADASHSIQQIVIYNVVGQQVMVVEKPAADQRIDISGLVGGTYFVKVITDKGKTTEKLMKL